MHLPRIALFYVLSASLTGTANAAEPDTPQRYGVELTWDLNLEGGAGFRLDEAAPVLGLGRIRGGLMWADLSDFGSPKFHILGAQVSYTGLGELAFGLQAETMGLSSGLWAQIGASITTDVEPRFDLSFGWSLFGIEGELVATNGGAAGALFFKLRAPLGMIVYAMSN